MVTFQDASVGVVAEGTYKTYVPPTRFFEFLDHSLDWNKQIKQGLGLRVASRVARSPRRAYVAGDGGGDLSVEAVSKGMGVLWQAALGAGVSTMVSGSTQQQLFTIGDTPASLTVQTGIPEVGGSVDAFSWLGCMVESWEFDFPNADIASLKLTLDAGDLSTAQSYVSPTYPTAPVNLFHFQNGTIFSGTVTPPTTTALATAVTATANIRSGTIVMNNNIRQDRFNFGGLGRKSKPTPGLREITGTLVIEYDSTTYRDLILNDGALTAIVGFTGGALSVSVETLQIVLSEIKLNGKLPAPNGTDLITQEVSFTGLDNLSAAQPIWVATRTADATI